MSTVRCVIYPRLLWLSGSTVHISCRCVFLEHIPFVFSFRSSSCKDGMYAKKDIAQERGARVFYSTRSNFVVYSG